MTNSLLPLLYRGGQYEGWGEGMRAITRALLANLTLPDGLVVEVGCGGGQLLAELQQSCPTRMVIGTDLHPLALALAQRELPPQIGLVQSALPDLPWRKGEVALLLALDVFDQQGVELDAALVPVGEQKEDRDIFGESVEAGPAAFEGALRRLDLDDIGTDVGQHLHGGWPLQEVRETEYLDTF